jgi:hypothetical protein
MDRKIEDVSLIDEGVILAIDTHDDELERAAGNDIGQAITWMYCSYDWYCRF